MDVTEARRREALFEGVPTRPVATGTVGSLTDQAIEGLDQSARSIELLHGALALRGLEHEGHDDHHRLDHEEIATVLAWARRDISRAQAKLRAIRDGEWPEGWED